MIIIKLKSPSSSRFLNTDIVACNLRVPGNALHPDFAAVGGAEAPGDSPLDVPLQPGLRDHHLLLKLPPGRRLANEIRARAPVKAGHGHKVCRRRRSISVSHAGSRV